MTLASQPKRLALVGHEPMPKIAGEFSPCEKGVWAGNENQRFAPQIDGDVKQPVTFLDTWNAFDKQSSFCVHTTPCPMNGLPFVGRVDSASINNCFASGINPVFCDERFAA